MGELDAEEMQRAGELEAPGKLQRGGGGAAAG